MEAPASVQVLSHHAAYVCRRSGACCTAGWRIPVEPDRVPAIRTLRHERAVFEDGTTMLRLTPAGACVLYEPGAADRRGGCLAHRTRGHAALPSACRHFPRIYLHDAHATRLTLSHFCPTAASLLFEREPLRIGEAPIALAALGDREGLDARDALPPLLHPGMLMDAASYAAWEAQAVAALAGDGTPEDALRRIAASAERLRSWSPASMSLMEAVRGAGEAGDEDVPVPGVFRGAEGSAWLADAAFASVPSDLTVDRGPLDVNADGRFVVPVWAEFAAPVRRYLAGRLFGSWVAYQGRGLRTVVASVACALAVLRIEAARACAAARRPLDAALLTEAIRQADLLLVHRADRQILAGRLSQVEKR